MVWLAGAIGLDAWGAMVERLAWDVSEPDGRPPTLVVCELERSVTVGRLGSRFDVELSDEELLRARVPLRFVGRGGGAILHYPGQVHVALFATLADLGLDPCDAGGLVERMESGLEGAVRMLRCGAARDSGRHGVFGRGGLLAALGMAVRRGVASHGAWLNVTSPPSEGRRVRTVSGAPRPAGPMAPGIDVEPRLAPAGVVGVLGDAMVAAPSVAVTDERHPSPRIAKTAAVDEEERPPILDAPPERRPEEDRQPLPDADGGSGEGERQPRRAQTGDERLEEGHLPGDPGMDVDHDVGSGHHRIGSSAAGTPRRDRSRLPVRHHLGEGATQARGVHRRHAEPIGTAA